jgi:hypothetical protein
VEFFLNEYIRRLGEAEKGRKDGFGLRLKDLIFPDTLKVLSSPASQMEPFIWAALAFQFFYFCQPCVMLWIYNCSADFALSALESKENY